MPNLKIYGGVVFNGREYIDDEILELVEFTDSELKGWKYAGDVGQREGSVAFVVGKGRKQINKSFGGTRGLIRAINWLVQQDEDSPIFDDVFAMFEKIARKRAAAEKKAAAKKAPAKKVVAKKTNVKKPVARKPKWQKHLDAKEIALFEKTAKAVGRKFTGYDYWNWLGEDGVESEEAYNAFERAVKRKMGAKFYEAAESYARCDNLLHAIIAGKVTHKDGITENLLREWKKEQRRKAKARAAA